MGFRGDGYVELKESLANEEYLENPEVKIEFSTLQDGLVYWHGQESHKAVSGKDRIALAGELLYNANKL